MTRLPQPISKLLACLLFGSLLSVALPAAVPGFVGEGLYGLNASVVAQVVPSPAADVVILEGGLEQGIRPGMVYRVARDSESIGELVVIESNRARSAALILSLNQNNFIRRGDQARAKTIQTS